VEVWGGWGKGREDTVYIPGGGGGHALRASKKDSGRVGCRKRGEEGGVGNGRNGVFSLPPCLPLSSSLS
jgi:hypothetical protein